MLTTIEEYGSYMANSALISSGKIVSAIENIYKDAGKKDFDVAEVIKSFEIGDFDSIDEELKPYFGELYDKIANALPEAWSDIIKNLDGKNLIEVDDTNRDIYKDLETKGIVKQISDDWYQVVAEKQKDIITAILESGMNPEDINKQLVEVEEYYNSKAGEKEVKLTNLIDIIDDPAKVEISVLETLANNFGKTIEEIKWLFSENLDGTYSTGLAQINYLINEFGLESSAEIKDALQEYFNSILGYISNGISGSMTNVEVVQLQDFINQYDADLNLQLTRTAEGFKLTQDSVLQVYSTLENVDNLAAQVVLDELTESAMDSDENLNNIYKVMGKIKNLNEDIETYKGTEREEVLKRELKLAENIRDTLMEAGDAFNFMDQNLPTGMTNPLSAWEGMGQAFEVLDGEDFKAGKIDFTDFYNIINQLDSAGIELSTVAEGFNDDTQTASDLIRAAARALTVIDGETFVDLSKLGETFKVSADGMKEGLTDGIKIIAESQIELIDAQIAVLETVVKTQEAFEKVDLDQDSQINYPEFINNLFGNNENFSKAIIDEKSFAYQELMKYARTELITLRNEVITVETALELLGDESTRLDDRITIADSLQKFFNNLYSEISSIDWSIAEGQLYKEGIKLQIPKVSFDVGQNQEALITGLGEFGSEIQGSIRNFIENNKEEVSLSDLITFSIEQGYSNEVINYLYSLFEESTIEIEGQKYKYNLELQAYVSENEKGKYILPDGTAVDEAGYQKYAEETFTPPKTETEIQTSTKITLLSDNISIGTESENGLTEIEIDGVIARTSSIEITASDENIKFTKDGKEITGPEFVAQLQLINITDTQIKRLAEAVAAIEVPENLVTQLEAVSTALLKIGESASSIQEAPISRVGTLATNINNIPTGSKTLSVQLQISSTGNVSVNSVDNTTGVKGTIANLSLATGNAYAKGTLMGELGPELYVTGGRYFVAGQNGAEFVDLPNDAIVFNHLQTKKLLGNGSINGTGKPVTNERNATALATGTTGSAKASAQDALKELYEIRAMWQSLLNASSKNLGQKAGGSGGGNDKENKAFLHNLERWYNLLRQIEKLEQQITYEQAKRANMQSGYKYSDSLQKELILLKKQQAAHQELSDLQRKYYDERRKVLEKTSYGELIFTYDEDGLMQYHEEEGKGLDILAELERTDENGKAVRTAEEQVEFLKSVGFDTSTLLVNADGSKVESNDYQTMMQIFWDGVDGWMEELDGLYDSYNDSMTSVQESIEAQMKIQQEYIDNQLTVEEKLLQAIIDREQAEIDRLQGEKEALEEATSAYIDGLNNALDREKEMYEKNDTAAETARLQRQLAILQRSGGSAAEIRSLQDQIDSRLQDAYFQEQQDQIDAIQEASNNQLEKMQEQIDIMTEALEYQKENGLLWAEVYEMMNLWTPDQMLQFIEEFTKSYKEDSDLQNQEKSKETQKQTEIWDAGKDREEREKAWSDYYNSLSDYSEEFKKEHAEGAKIAFDEAYNKEGLDAAKKAADDYYKKVDSQEEKNPEETGEEKEPEETIPPETETSKETEKKGDSSGSAGKKTSYKRGDSGEIVRKIQETLNRRAGKNFLVTDGIFGAATENAVKSFQRDMQLKEDGIVGAQTLKKLGITAFKTGGLVDFTGPAWVDGTKSKPEAFLSASDTAMLKSKIFSNSDGSLKALVAALEEITNNTSRYSTETNSEQIIIQNAQVNIQPGTISNDYSARRAGEMALEEMVKIARKTTNRVVSR